MTILADWLRLSETSENILAVGVSIFIACSGVKVVRSQDLAFEIADYRLAIDSSASKLDELAAKLDRATAIIQEKDAAIARLEEVYRLSLKGKKGYGKLQQAIESVENISPVEDIDRLKTEIIETKQTLESAVGDRDSLPKSDRNL